MATIIDSNVTTLIAAVVLFSFGTGPVKGFAVTLFFGILTSMFTAIIGQPRHGQSLLRRPAPESAHLGASITPWNSSSKTNIDFMRIRWQAISLSSLVNLIGIASFICLGFNFGLDFTGGTVVEVGYEQPADLVQVRSALDGRGLRGGHGAALRQHPRGPDPPAARGQADSARR